MRPAVVCAGSDNNIRKRSPPLEGPASVRRIRRWVWGALSSGTAVFRIAPGRHAFEARTLLGERFAGIVCSDRWPGYDYLDPTQRQLCWAHLVRDFTAHSEGMADQQAFGYGGPVIAHDLFAASGRH